MKLCTVEGCEKKHAARGLCITHYNQQRHLGKFTDKKCSVDGCEKHLYSLGYCRTHEARARRNGTPETYREIRGTCKKCDAVAVVDGLCKQHKRMFDKWGDSDNYRKVALSGENNYRWNGGVADYPDHHTFKKNRKIVLENSKGLCERCNADAKHVHHIDGSKDNHSINNLMALCIQCHRDIHRGMKRQSKYRRLYGASLAELSEQLEISVSSVKLLHELGKLEKNLGGVCLEGLG